MPLKSVRDLAVPTTKVRIAEDCAGLGTGFCTFKRSAHDLNRKAQATKAAANNSQYRPLRRRKQRELLKKIQIDPVYMSENHPPLRRFLRHKWPLTKIVEDSNLGSDSRGDTLLGKDGDIDVYIAGNSCQPFSKQGKNGGRKDMRSNATRDSVDFIKKRRPKCFIIEQVKNITSKTHKKWLQHRILLVIKHLKREDGKKLYKSERRFMTLKGLTPHKSASASTSPVCALTCHASAGSKCQLAAMGDQNLWRHWWHPRRVVDKSRIGSSQTQSGGIGLASSANSKVARM